jgi:heterodisulfide reductase subunit B
MELSYFPGCSLHSTAREYDASTRAVFEALGIKLDELEDWNCCGSTSAHSVNAELSRLLPQRNLRIAEKAGRDLLIPCAACYSRSKAAEVDRKAGDRDISPPSRRIRIHHILGFLEQEEILERFRDRITRPLRGLRAVCYYGCLTSRPPEVTGAADHENPQSMDRLVEICGAATVPWSFKTDCCGAGLTVSRSDVVIRLVGRLLMMAEEAGADCIVVACTMCHMNLDALQGEAARLSGPMKPMPVFYISELLGLAMEHPDAPRWLGRHLTNPGDILRLKGFDG